jgi:hypothetical protein
VSALETVLPGALAELAPLVRRVADLDAGCAVRLRLQQGSVTAFARLPFGVLVARTVSAEAITPAADATVRAAELLGWLDGEQPDPPPDRGAEWSGGVPPVTGWQRIETVPDTAIRPLVRTGALTLKEAAAREGLPNRQPSRAVSNAVLDAVVLTVTADTAAADGTRPSAEVTLRSLSALTRMGFLARGSEAHIDVCGRWTRVAGTYGSVYAESAGGLALSPS